MKAFHRRQFLLLGLIVVMLIVATAASALLRGVLTPVFWGKPFYINPYYLLLVLLVGGGGLFTVLRADDRGWPLFLGLLGLVALVLAFEDSILQWFVMQLRISTTGGRVNPVLITALLAAFALAVLLHVGQLGRRLRHGFVERGIDPRELTRVEERVFATGRSIALQLLGLGAAASVALFIGQVALGKARIGIGPLGILGGLLILSLLSVMAYRLLRTGAPRMDVEDLDAAARRPPKPRRRG